jgi:hypothetical protein
VDASEPMSGDDATATILHMWRITSVRFETGGATTFYACELHPFETLEVKPGEVHPAEC